MKQRDGFTFIEVMIAAALMTIIASLSLVNYGRQRPMRDLTSTKMKIIALLRDASTRSATQSQGASWGVRFQSGSATSSYFALFFNTYASGTVQQFGALPSTLRFDTSTFLSGTTDITFSKISGRANTSTVIKAYIASDPTKSFSIRIDSSGLISESGVTNVALNKTANQISTWVPGVASRAVDGNTDGDWLDNSVSHTNTNGQDWWQVDLGQNYSLDYINIWNRTDNCAATCSRLSNYYVFVSDNPFGSATLAALIASSTVWNNFQAATAGRPTTVPVQRSGRYVRVQLSVPNYLHMGEVEVFGK